MLCVETYRSDPCSYQVLLLSLMIIVMIMVVIVVVIIVKLEFHLGA